MILKKIATAVVVTVNGTIFPSIVFAQSSPPKFQNIGTMFMGIIDLAFPIAAFVALFMLVIGGYMWMIAAGDPQKLQRAQGTIVWSIIGLVFLAIIRMLIEVTLEFFGIAV